jgi:hypothetical protein
VNIGTDDGRARWLRDGSPTIPAVRNGEVVTTISTLAQVAAAIGIPPPPGAPIAQEAGDCLAILDAWVAHMRVVDLAFLSAPTPSRGRTLRELTVNVFNPFALAPAAWETGGLPWHPANDREHGDSFATHEEITAYAAEIAMRWGEFLALNESELDDPERPVVSPRGEMQWGPFVSSQRWHAAFHYRQLVAFAGLQGVRRPAGALELSSLRGLELPDDVF